MQTEEHIEKQDKVLNSLDNKRRMVTDFMAKGEKLMQDPNCPKFLEGHVHKLKEAWEDTNQKAQERKKALAGKKHCESLTTHLALNNLFTNCKILSRSI